MPHSGSIPLYWRIRKSKYNLIGGFCSNCNKTFFPFKKTCASCGNEVKEVFLPTKGTVITYTKIFTAPTGFEEQTPYVIGIIELENGVKVCAQIVDDVEIGDKVEAVFRRIFEKDRSSPINYGLKFRKIVD